jgi:hypothetical protein
MENLFGSWFQKLSTLQWRGHGGTEQLTSWRPGSKERENCARRLFSFSPCILLGPLTDGIVLYTFRVSLPLLVKSLWKALTDTLQRVLPISWALFSPIKLTLKINHHRYICGLGDNDGFTVVYLSPNSFKCIYKAHITLICQSSLITGYKNKMFYI